MDLDLWHYLPIFLALLIAVFVLKKVLRIIVLLVLAGVAFVMLTGRLPDLGW